MALFVPCPVPAQSYSQAAVYIVLIPELSSEDIHNLSREPAFSWLGKAAIGIMNTRTAISLRDTHAAVTLSSGVRAASPEEGRRSYGVQEQGGKALRLYKQLHGNIPGGITEDSIVFPSIVSLIKENERRNTGAIPGLLGDVLEQHGIKRAAAGNSDTESISRIAPLLTMNRQGMTPYGAIGTEVLRDVLDFPGGHQTDGQQMLERAAMWRQSGVRFIVLEQGDLARLARYRNGMSERRYTALRTEVLREIMTWVGTLQKQMQGEDRLLVLSASLPLEAVAQKKRLAPVLLWDGTTGGVLTSGTTRRPGLVANIDIAPTVLTWFGIAVPSEMKGLPLSVMREGKHAELWQDVTKMNHIYATRPDVLYPYVGLVVILLVLSALSLTSWSGLDRFRHRLSTVLPFVLRALLFVPPALLVLPLLPASPRPAVVWLLLLFSCSLGAYITGRLTFLTRFFWIGLLGWFPILLDGLLGAELMKHSYLGYDPVIGARYYGIGNEYMGVLLGGWALSLALLADSVKNGGRRPSWMIAAGSGVGLLGYVAWPGLGSKAGGIFVFIAASLYLSMRLAGLRFSPRKILMALGIAVISAILFLAINYRLPAAEQSHIGRAVGELVAGNWPEIGRIIERKLTMNWKLILSSAWSRLFLVSVLLAGLVAAGRRTECKRLSTRYPGLPIASGTIAVGSITAVLLNDSGIIAAALAVLYALVPYIEGLIEEVREEGRTSSSSLNRHSVQKSLPPIWEDRRS